MQEKRSRSSLTFEGAPARWWRNIAIPALPVLACFLGGATEKWSEGIVLAFLGLLLLFDPPRSSLRPALNVILIALVGCAATAFLPSGWFATPPWRLIFANNFGINLPGTLSPQPFISLGCFVSLLAGLSWLYYVSTLDLELRDVRRQLRFFATGIILLAALCIALYYTQSSLPFWNNQRGFGPFPNRNQTANIFGLTAVVILACGQDDIRKGRKRWIAWLIGLGVIVAAIQMNFSRAGILLLLAGIALWFVGFALCKRTAVGIGVGLSALLILLTVVVVFGGDTLERFHLRGGEVGDISTDLRWAIFKDTLQMIQASPWLGIGLGNFDEIFAVFRNASLNGNRTIHPESDWLWLWAEMGWLAIPLILAGAAILVRRVFPLQEGTNQRFRLAVLIAAILFALHGLVDVAGHRVGTAFAGVFLFGMALRRPVCLPASRVVSWIFRLIGLVILVSGMAWVVATRYEMPLPGGVGVENEIRLATAASQGQDFKEAIQRTTRALEWAPLRWQLYFSRAIAKVGANRPVSDALDDFRRARFLEPNAYEVPYQEGIVWLGRDPALALAAWQEALRRVGVQRLEIYGHMLAMSAQHNPTVRQGLARVGVASHDLALVYLQGATGQDFKAAVQDVLENDPNLQSFSKDERAKFFALWVERGDPEESIQAVEAHPDWMGDAWRSVARHRANRKQFRPAFEIVSRFGSAPTMPKSEKRLSIEQLEQASHANPDNLEFGYQLYREEMETGRTDNALMTIRHFTERSDCPRYFHYLEAEAWARKENWERAWNAWETFDKQ